MLKDINAHGMYRVTVHLSISAKCFDVRVASCDLVDEFLCLCHRSRANGGNFVNYICDLTTESEDGYVSFSHEGAYNITSLDPPTNPEYYVVIKSHEICQSAPTDANLLAMEPVEIIPHLNTDAIIPGWLV